ncbi:MAG: hypothetical protein Q9227_008745 [Pyrenula ochraceoflavens]
MNAQIGSLFWSHYLPDSISIPSLLAETPGMWTETPRVLSMSEPALELSFLSVSSARLGHDFNDPRLLQQGWQAYCSGMRELHKALMDPRRLYTDEVLSASGMLALYEAFEGVSPGFTAWMTHIQGSTRILGIRGPASSMTDTGYMLLLGQRIQEAVIGLRNGTTSILASNKWRTVPWNTRPKDLRDQLLDIMLLLPAATGPFDPFQANLQFDPRQIDNMTPELLGKLDHCWAIDSDLMDWYGKVEEKANGSPLFYQQPTSVQERQESSLTHMISFPDIRTGQTLCLYWTCCHLLFYKMREIYQLLLKATTVPRLGSFDIGKSEPPELPARIDPDPYILLVAQSIPYFLDESGKAAGRTLIAFPTMAALQALAHPEVGQMMNKPALMRFFMVQIKKVNMKGLPAPFPGFVRKSIEAAKKGVNVTEVHAREAQGESSALDDKLANETGF